MSELFRLKHQLWLSFTFGSFAHPDSSIKDRLYEFSMIEFRHLKWLASHLYENNIPYDYSRDVDFSIAASDDRELLANIVSNIHEVQKLYLDSELFSRMRDDERYFIYELENLSNDETQTINAFNKNLKYLDASMDKSELDALVLFLFEELYKEYELILIYFYQQTRAKDIAEFSSFDDLIYESHFHLRSFGEMMSELGVLALPRQLHPRTYIIEDLKSFLIAGIAEEEAAKEQCKTLSGAIKYEPLSRFFDFINLQESYHIAIMKKLLQRY